MKRKLLIGVVLLILWSSMASAVSASRMVLGSRGQILYVGGVGPGNYSTIQGAVDAASDGDTIRVYPKTYTENVVLDKQLFLEGVRSGASTPVINGGDSASPIFIQNDSCVIENFSLLNGDAGFLQSTVQVSSNYNTIKNCTMYHTGAGIRCRGYSGNLFRDNEITGEGYRGIELWSAENNTVINNFVHGRSEQALYLRSASHNWIYRNAFISCDVILIEDSPYNLIEENNISDLQDGLQLSSAHGTIVRNNIINAGIFVGGSKEDLLSYTITDNVNHGKPLKYYTNLDGVTVPQDTGEIFLVNCSHFLIENSRDSDGRLFLYFSSNNTITLNSAFDRIQLVNSSDNMISWNSLEDGGGGVSLGSSHRNTLRHNAIANNIYEFGLVISSSSGNIVENNSIRNSRISVEMWYSQKTTFSNNTVENSSWYGLWTRATLMTIDHNTFRNGGGGIYMEGGTNILKSNTISNFESGIILDTTLATTVSYNTVEKNQIGINMVSSVLDRIVSNQIQGNDVGVKETFTTGTHVASNNIVLNVVDATFTYHLWQPSTNKWRANYWGTLQILRHKVIYGVLNIVLYSDPWYHDWTVTLPWVVHDWFPAKEPFTNTTADFK